METSKNIFKSYDERIKIRKETGINEINNLLNNFLYVNKTRKSLKKIIDILEKNSGNETKQTNKIKLTTFLSKAEQYDRMRIWSSFRIDQIVNNLEEKSAKGVDLVRSMIAATVASIPNSYCWVNDKQLGTFHFLNWDPKNIQKIANVQLTQIWNDQSFENRGFMFIKKCEIGQEDCTIFCSNSNCETLEDFKIKEMKIQSISFIQYRQKGYEKKGNFCYPDCKYLGMIECEHGICGISKKSCEFKRPTPTKELVESYVEFLGHIYSLKSNSTFGWSNPESFKKYKKLLADKYLQENNEWHYEVSLALKNYDVARRSFLDNFIKKTLSFFIISKDNDAFKGLLRVIHPEFNRFASKYTSELIDEEIKVVNLDNCDIKRWVGVRAVKLGQIDRSLNERKIFKLKLCIETVDSLLRSLAPFMLFGYASGFSKPLCPFKNTFNPSSNILDNI